MLLALTEAESHRDSDAERWYIEPYHSWAKAALLRGDMAGLQSVVNEITLLRGSDDISFGCTQQTWRWSDEYAAVYGKSTAGRNDLAGMLRIREKYTNPQFALRKAAKKMQAILARPDVQGDELMALFKWNRAAEGVMPPLENQVNYKAALGRAHPWFEADVQALQERANIVGDHAFQFGFADKADELRNNGIDPGEPVEEEVTLQSGHTLQTTTTGIMFYSPAGYSHFLEGV